MIVRDIFLPLICAVLCCTDITARAQTVAADSTDISVRAQASIEGSPGIAAGAHVTDSTGSVLRENLLKSKVDSLRESMGRRRNVSVSALRAAGDSLRLRYEFASSVRVLETALDACTDSLERDSIEERLLLSRNGLSMSDYCSRPTVIARKCFSIEDFFLYYPMRERSWRALPNCLDSAATHPLVRASYIPDGAEHLYFSAPDASGIYNIYHTENQDTAWSVPSLVNEEMTTAHDEIFPVLSEDGKSLYFASAGLYGMGGYDLYVSHWNERTRDWDTPMNLGFPYSSPYDDFLYFNSEDGRYTIFASNRDCSRDSVIVYVLEYDSLPLHSAVTEPSDLRRLAALEPGSARPAPPSNPSPSLSEAAPRPMGEDMSSYLDRMNTVRSLRDSLSAFTSELDVLRASLGSASEEERKQLSSVILKKEMELIPLQKSLGEAVKALQATEMEFLEKGVVIDPESLMAPSPEQGAAAVTSDEAPEAQLRFIRHSMGEAPVMNILQPEPIYDLTFRIGAESQILDAATALPDGIIYQIQIMSSAREADARELRALNPVFLDSSGRYVYSVGAFRSYSEALSHLNRVRTLGFRSAFITALKDRSPISVLQARSLE